MGLDSLRNTSRDRRNWKCRKNRMYVRCLISFYTFQPVAKFTCSRSVCLWPLRRARAAPRGWTDWHLPSLYWWRNQNETGRVSDNSIHSPPRYINACICQTCADYRYYRNRNTRVGVCDHVVPNQAYRAGCPRVACAACLLCIYRKRAFCFYFRVNVDAKLLYKPTRNFNS